VNIRIDEAWKPIKGYEGLYEVSNLGRVKSFVGYNGHQYIEREKILKTTIRHYEHGYCNCVVNLTKNKKKKTFRVHRLVAEAFIPNIQNKPCINHLDGNPLNNGVDNLEWCTQRENIIHAVETGLRKKFYISKETLFKLYVVEKKTIKEIADIYGVSRFVIQDKLKKYGIKRRTQSEIKIKYNLTEIFLVNELENKTQKELANEIGCDQSLISHYVKRIRERGNIYAQ
jgi:transposase